MNTDKVDMTALKRKLIKGFLSRDPEKLESVVH